MPLEPPPLNADGNVAPHDHNGILETDIVIRRIAPGQKHIVEDPKVAGGRRLSSIAFKPSSRGSKGWSVDLEHQIRDAGLNVSEYVTTPIYTGSIYLPVGPLREENFRVGFEPTAENPHHGEVWFEYSKQREKVLRRLAHWLVEIPDVSILTSDMLQHA